MKLISKLSLFITIVTLITFSSCVTNEITNITLNKSSLSFNVGQTDSVVATITFTGDLSQQALSWQVSNADVVSIAESSLTDNSTSGSSSTKTILFTALKEGSTSVTFQAGQKTVSCNITVGKQNLIFDKAFAANWGDYYGNGNNNYTMYMFDSNLTVDTTGNIIGNGSYIYIDFNLPITQDVITAGTFSMSNTGSINTFFPGELYEDSDGNLVAIGTQLVTITGETSTITLLVDGTYAIVVSGDHFIFEGDFITDTNEQIHCSYEGTLNVADLRETPVELYPNFTHGQLVYFGDIYGSGNTNNYYVILATENQDINDSILTGEMMYIELNTDISVTDSITNGTYTMMPDLTYEYLVPGSIVFGYESTDGYILGSWYLGETYKALETGNAIFSKNGANYSIQYQFFDKIGSKVSGTYSGPLTYLDATNAAASVKASKVKSSVSAKNKFQNVLSARSTVTKYKSDLRQNVNVFKNTVRIKRKL